MTNRCYRGLFLFLALFGASFDLASKYAAFRWLYADGRDGVHEILPGAFKLIAQFDNQRAIEYATWRAPFQALNGDYLPHVNHGALFGMGGRFQANANGFFAVVSLVAALGIIAWSFRERTARDGVLCAALGLILGGTIGNLFDRIVFHGVRDFLYFYWIEWPVFNFADCCLVVGASLLLMQAFWPSRATDAERRESPQLVEMKA